MKRRSKAIILLAIVEIIAGILGSGIFFLCVFNAIMNFDKYLSDTLERFFGISLAIASLPFVLVLLSGIGLLGLKSWARKINIFVIPPLLFAESILWIMLYYGRGGRLLGSLTFAPLWLFLILKIWFLMRPKIKLQFK